jgi:hypothetical protein
MEYLSRGVQCVGDVCYVVGSVIGRTVVQGAASLPVSTKRNTYKNRARQVIARLSPEATRFYREAYVQGSVEEDGRIDRDAIRSMGFFERDYPFPGGPMGVGEVGRAFDELRDHGLIHFAGRNRYDDRDPSLFGIVGNVAEGARQLERSWGMREPNAPLFPNAVNGNRRRNPYVYLPPRAPVAAAAGAEAAANEEPALFNVPRQNIYGSPNFEDILTFEPIPEGSEVLRITGRTGSDPNRSTYRIPQTTEARLSFLRGLDERGINIATSAPFTRDQIQRGPYRYRPAAARAAEEPVAAEKPAPVPNTRRSRSRTSRNKTSRSSHRRQNHRK